MLAPHSPKLNGWEYDFLAAVLTFELRGVVPTFAEHFNFIPAIWADTSNHNAGGKKFTA